MTAFEPNIMRTFSSRAFIAPVAGIAFFLLVATSVPVQLAPAWAADETTELTRSDAALSVSAEGGEPATIGRDEIRVEIAPQPEEPRPDPAASSPSGEEAASGSAATSAPSSLAPISGGASPGAIFADLNAQRAAAGLPPFAPHGGLSGVAQQWSATQASRMSMVHNPAFASQTSAVGCGGATENVASASGATSPVAAWMASPPHRANILSGATHLGVGAATASNGITYYTLNFASC